MNWIADINRRSLCFRNRSFWNGASLDLYVNDVLVGDDLTIDDGAEASFEFDVEYYDQVHTEWTEGQ